MQEPSLSFPARMKRRIKQVGVFVLIMFVGFHLISDNHGIVVLRHPRYHGNTGTATPSDLQGVLMKILGFIDLQASEVEKYVKSEELIEEFEYPLQSIVCASYVHIIAVVFSKPKNFNERQAVRNTWGSEFRSETMKLVFLVGQTDQATNELIAKEHRQYSDIVQSSFIDSYTNLVFKTVAMLQWASQFCSQANFLLKIDDDVFLFTNNLLSLLESVKDERRFIMGNINAHSTPYRGDHKWRLSQTVYPFDRLPTYADGPAYVVSSDLVPRLHEISRHKPRMHLEDVYVTGLCAFLVQANHIKSCGFSSRLSTYLFVSYIIKCSMKTIHELNTEQMYTLWETSK